MAWVAVDRAVKAVERFGLEAGDVGAPCGRRSTNRCVGKDTMPAWGHLFSYGGKNLDAGLLMIPLVGFFQRAAEDRRHS